MVMDFHNCDRDTLGRFGEAVCKNVLQSCGFTYIPLCDLTKQGAPMASSNQGKVILPDYDVADLRAYLDAKAKSHAVRWKKTGQLRHGINQSNFEHYKKIGVVSKRMCGLFVVELFTDEQDEVWSGAILAESFLGLGVEIKGFNENPPKVYWPRERFKQLARLNQDELRAIANGRIGYDCSSQLRQIFTEPPKQCETCPPERRIDGPLRYGRIPQSCGICGRFYGYKEIEK